MLGGGKTFSLVAYPALLLSTTGALPLLHGVRGVIIIIIITISSAKITIPSRFCNLRILWWFVRILYRDHGNWSFLNSSCKLGTQRCVNDTLRMSWVYLSLWTAHAEISQPYQLRRFDLCWHAVFGFTPPDDTCASSSRTEVFNWTNNAAAFCYSLVVWSSYQ